eukprot:SAG31_NODE_438_length_15693_cov_6.254248_7_plen_147_part_00
MLAEGKKRGLLRVTQESVQFSEILRNDVEGNVNDWHFAQVRRAEAVLSSPPQLHLHLQGGQKVDFETQGARSIAAEVSDSLLQFRNAKDSTRLPTPVLGGDTKQNAGVLATPSQMTLEQQQQLMYMMQRQFAQQQGMMQPEDGDDA